MNVAKAKAAQRAQKLAALKGKGKATATTESAPPPAADATPAPAPVARPRPSVTQYWGDGVSAMTAPGGGILRIGYDQAQFEQACKDVLIEPEDLSPKASAPEGEAEPAVKVELKKDDVAVVVKELELSTKEAEAALRRAGGDLAKALWALTAPQPVKQYQQGPGGRPAIGVGADL